MLMPLFLIVETRWAWGPSVAYSQTLALTQEKYQRGDLKGAETAAKKALEAKIPRTERAKVYKILGLIHYLTGQKPQATKAFEQALANDPTLTIQAQESLDPSALTFFQSIKAKARKDSPTANASLPSGSKTSKSIAGTAPAKKTLLKVVSNVSKAQVSIDGILAGATNELINVEPGKIEIEVTSPGYLPRKATVPISKDAENTITLNLEKPRPKTSPSPPTVAQRPSSTKIANKKPASRRPPREEDLFAPTPSDFNEASPAPGRANKKGTAGAAEVTGDPAAAFEEEAMMGGSPMPSYGGGGYAQPTQPIAPQPTSPTPGFGMAPPAAAPPQPIYTQPPVYYQPPMYQPPMYQPPMYQQPMYYPPPATLAQPAPPPDPYTGMPPMDQGPPDPSYRSDGNGKYEVTLITLLPCGIGQMTQKRYLVAPIFAGGCAGAAFFAFYYLNEEITGEKKAYNDVVKQCRGTTDDDAKKQCATYFADQKKTITELGNQQQMAQLGLIGVMVVSSLEAAMWEPDAKPTGSSKRRRRSNRKYRGFSTEIIPPSGISKTVTAEVGFQPLILIGHDAELNKNIFGSQFTLKAHF